MTFSPLLLIEVAQRDVLTACYLASTLNMCFISGHSCNDQNRLSFIDNCGAQNRIGATRVLKDFHQSAFSPDMCNTSS